jgi:hypothetical protein
MLSERRARAVAPDPERPGRDAQALGQLGRRLAVEIGLQDGGGLWREVGQKRSVTRAQAGRLVRRHLGFGLLGRPRRLAATLGLAASMRVDGRIPDDTPEPAREVGLVVHRGRSFDGLQESVLEHVFSHLGPEPLADVGEERLALSGERAVEQGGGDGHGRERLHLNKRRERLSVTPPRPAG